MIGDICYSYSQKNGLWLELNGSGFNSSEYPELYNCFLNYCELDNGFNLIPDSPSRYFYCNGYHFLYKNNKLYYDADYKTITTSEKNVNIGFTPTLIKYVNNLFIVIGDNGSKCSVAWASNVEGSWSVNKNIVANTTNTDTDIYDITYFNGYYIAPAHIIKSSNNYGTGYMYSDSLSSTTWNYCSWNTYTDSSSYSYFVLNCEANYTQNYCYFYLYRSGSTDKGYIGNITTVGNSISTKEMTSTSNNTFRQPQIITIGNYTYFIYGIYSSSSYSTYIAYCTTSAPTTYTTLLTPNTSTFSSGIIGDYLYINTEGSLYKINQATYNLIGDCGQDYEPVNLRNGLFYNEENNILIFQSDSPVTNLPSVLPTIASGISNLKTYIKAK